MTMEVITELTLETFKMLQKMTNKTIIIKFSAIWCKPCEKIKEHVNKKFLELNDNRYMVIDLDIDKQPEVFTKLKAMKMIKGIPSILKWENKPRDEWYISDDSVSGGDFEKIDKFFDACD